MTSNPLFIIVAESMVIFFPISQLGWFKASSMVISTNVLIALALNGPPLPVKIILRTSSNDSPAKHCQMAECSLSTGKRRAPVFSIVLVIISPAITKLSLFDKATSTQARTASRVGSIPKAPTKPFSISSTSFLPANSISPSRPERTSMPSLFTLL